jgi:hypothetical protein
VRSASARAESGGAPRRRLRGSRYSSVPAMQKTSISTGRRSAALKMWSSSKSHLPHQGVDFRYSASIIWAARRTSWKSASSALARHCSAKCLTTGWSTGRRIPGRRPNRRLRGPRPARSSAATGCRRTRGTGPRRPSRPGRTGTLARRGLPPVTAAPPPSRPPPHGTQPCVASSARTWR